MTLETSPCSSNIFHPLIPVSGLFPGTPDIAIWRGILGHVFKKWLKEIWRHGNSLPLALLVDTWRCEEGANGEGKAAL